MKAAPAKLETGDATGQPASPNPSINEHRDEKFLTQADLDRFFRFRITEESLALHQVRRVSDHEARNECGIRWNGGDLAGIAFPICGADGAIKGYRVRRDNPESENGKPKNKYIASADQPHLYFESSSRPYLAEASIPVIFVEAYSSALAVACWCHRTHQEYLIIACAGCWGWRGRIGKTENVNGHRVDEKGPSPDLSHIVFEKREVSILFDANVLSNAKVQAAVAAFTKELQGRGAVVRLPVLPEESGVNGPDDYLSLHHDNDLTRLLASARTADNDEEFLNMLARLPRIEYDRQREAAAAKLSIRVVTLDAEMEARRPVKEESSGHNGARIMLQDPDPWPEAADGAALADILMQTFRRFLVLPDGADVALTLFVFHTYALDAAEASPILAITSPEKRCGKTAVIRILKCLCRRPLPAANITTAALFRTVEVFKPTLLIDEADSFLKDNEELRGVLNSGHDKATAVVIRTTGDTHEPTTFSTWCAKAIALIGKLPGTLEDRSITIAMKRKSRSEKIERIRYSALCHETEDLPRKLARWALDHVQALTLANPDIPDELHDRAADCWRSLLAIADKFGGEWPDRARKAALALSSADELNDSSVTVQLLADIQTIFGNTEKLSSELLVEELSAMEDRPWPDWKQGKPITKTQLARLLGRYGIKPKRVRIGNETPRGYERNQFDDAFTRYLAFQRATVPQPTTDAGFSDFQSATPLLSVALQNGCNSQKTNECGAVALQKPETGEEERL